MNQALEVEQEQKKNQTLEPNFYSANPLNNINSIVEENRDGKKRSELIDHLSHQRALWFFYITLLTTYKWTVTVQKFQKKNK